MGDPIINTQVDAINTTLGNIKVDLAALRPSIRAIKDAIAETYLTDTIENVPIASFSDGADEIPVRELQVAIEPVQSLNGQTSPYPAGGGKNKWSFNASYQSASSGTLISLQPFVLPAGTYAISMRGSLGVAMAVTFRDSSNNVIKTVTIRGSNFVNNYYSTSFTLDSASATLNVYSSGAYDLSQIQIESGSTATAYAPYSNLCPISGHTEAVVTRTGKNLLTMDKTKWGQYGTDNHGYVANSGRFAPYDYAIQFEVGKTYVVNLYDGTQLGKSFVVGVSEYNSLNNRIVDSGWKQMPYTFTVNSATAKICVGFRDTNYSNTANYVAAIGTRLFITMTEEAATTYPISLGQTVYGGTLNVTTGVLTITHDIKDIGLLDWYTTASGFYANIYGSPANNQSSICSQYAFKPTANAAAGSAMISNLSDNEYAWYSNLSRVFIRDDSFNADPDAFKTAMNGVQLVYELATPTTVQLTAAEVETLFGQNNVWCSSGNVVKLTYRKAWEIALAEGE